MEINKTDKKLLKVFGIISVVLITVPIIAYLINFYKHSFSSIPADWANFGDYVGGILGPVVSLVTLFVTVLIAYKLYRIEEDRNQKNLDYSYKPEILIDEKIFYGYVTKMIPNRFPIEYSYESKGETYMSELEFPNQFGLKLYNVGLGATKKVVIKFEFELNDAIELIHAIHRISKEEDKIAAENGGKFFQITSSHPEHKRTSLIPIVKENRETINVILPISISSTPYIVPIPTYILMAYSTVCSGSVLMSGGILGGVMNFPPIKVTIHYLDIANNLHTKITDVYLGINHVSGSEYGNTITVKERETTVTKIPD